VQATNTEKFGIITGDVKQYLLEKLPLTVPADSGEKEIEDKKSLLELVTKDSETYCNENEFKQCLQSIKENIQKRVYPNDLNELLTPS